MIREFAAVDMSSVIFDLDGTLADTSRDLIEAANSTLDEAGSGRPLDIAVDKLTAFHGGRALLRAGLKRATGSFAQEDLVNNSYSRFLEIYEMEIDRFTRTYAGVETTLAEMHAAGWKLGVCTNKPERLAQILLDRLGLRRFLGSLVGADTLPVRKPDPAPLLHAIAETGGQPSRSVFVGDTAMDLNTARAAQVPIILVGFGPEERRVERLEPDAILDHFADLPGLASRLTV